MDEKKKKTMKTMMKTSSCRQTRFLVQTEINQNMCWTLSTEAEEPRSDPVNVVLEPG